jgi:hypothetical protein
LFTPPRFYACSTCKVLCDALSVAEETAPPATEELSWIISVLEDSSSSMGIMQEDPPSPTTRSPDGYSVLSSALAEA